MKGGKSSHMRSKAFLLSAIVASAILAGCSSPPPSGNLVNANFAQPLQGGATIEYQAFDTGGNPLGGVAGAEDLQCVQDAGAGNVPPQVPLQPCTPPETRVKGTVTGLAPGATYGLYFASGSDAMPELKIGDLDADGAVNVTFDEDYNGAFRTLELRVGNFIYAVGATGAGVQPLAPNPAFGDIQVTGTYKGKDLTLSISGLPMNSTYTGKLYYPNPEAENGIEPRVTFAVENGEVAYTLTDDTNIGDYKEFHIHLGPTQINLYKANITPA